MTPISHDASDKNTSKFSFIVGNPPYQEVIGSIDKSEQPTVTNVFQKYQLAVNEISKANSLIYPGARWLHRSGKGLRDFGQAQVNSKTLKAVHYWPKSLDLFTSVKISDGITIVFHGRLKTNTDWDFFYHNNNTMRAKEVIPPGFTLFPLDPQVAAIVKKTLVRSDQLGEGRLKARVTAQKTFGIESNFVELNSSKVFPLSKPPLDIENYCKIFTNNIAGKGGRASWYWLLKSEVRLRSDLIDKWKVIVSSMNPVGARGTGHSPLAEILKPGEIFGRSRMAVATFETMNEAENFFKFLRTDFARFHYACLGDSQTLLGENVPDLGNWLTHKTISFTGTVEELNIALCSYYGLNDEEKDFMKAWVGSLSPLIKIKS